MDRILAKVGGTTLRTNEFNAMERLVKDGFQWESGRRTYADE